ncbi:MAG: Ig-like domain repeat protein, partial [Rhodospirillales bacterium]|nr:Ig-like domain repeat protein [Acetobacter sp.]
LVIEIPYAGLAAPTGLITAADSFGNTVSIQATSCTASGGVLTCTASLPTANEPTGNNAVSLTQAADANYGGSTGTGTVTIKPAGSHGDDSVSGANSYGAAATPITILIPFTGSAPTGTITVGDTFGNTVSVAASNCQASGSTLVCAATLSTANEPVGHNPATVAEAADPNHAASSGSGTITINKAAPTAADTASGTGTYGAQTTPVSVTIPFAGTAAPTGSVSVTDSLGNTAAAPASICTANNQALSCVLNLPTANEPIGSNPVTVMQAADGNYNASTGSGTVTISTAAVSPVGGTSGGVQNVTINQGTASTLLTATLTYGGATPPTGAVTFTVDSGDPVAATCSTGPSQEICTATYPTGSLQAGTYTITAAEAGDANYIAGSATGVLTVSASAVSPILDTVSDVSNVAVVAGTATASLSASITYNGPVPTGTLTFSIPGGTPLAATCSAGPSPLACTGSYPTATLTTGTYVITATESADGTYAQGAATALLTVLPSAATPISPILTTGSYVESVLVPYGTSSAT